MALVLVLWVLVGAVTGGRTSAVVSGFVAAIAFDFFHTKPYGSLKISDGNDVLTTVLFERPPFIAGLPRIERTGVIEATEHRYANGEFELPRGGVALPVVAAGRTLGRFVLIPKPGVGVSKERRQSAVALADQVGAALGRTAA